MLLHTYFYSNNAGSQYKIARKIKNHIKPQGKTRLPFNNYPYLHIVWLCRKCQWIYKNLLDLISDFNKIVEKACYSFYTNNEHMNIKICIAICDHSQKWNTGINLRCAGFYYEKNKTDDGTQKM